MTAFLRPGIVLSMVDDSFLAGLMIGSDLPNEQHPKLTSMIPNVPVIVKSTIYSVKPQKPKIVQRAKMMIFLKLVFAFVAVVEVAGFKITFDWVVCVPNEVQGNRHNSLLLANFPRWG